MRKNQSNHLHKHLKPLIFSLNCALDTLPKPNATVRAHCPFAIPYILNGCPKRNPAQNSMRRKP